MMSEPQLRRYRQEIQLEAENAPEPLASSARAQLRVIDAILSGSDGVRVRDL